MKQYQFFELPPQQKKVVLPKKRQSIMKISNSDNDSDELKKTHHNHPQYKDTIENADKYIKQLSRLSWDRLGKNLDIIREQMGYAFKQKKYDAYELLYEWEKQNIMARLIKFDEETKNTKRKKRNVAKANDVD